MNAKKYKNARIIRASSGDWRVVYEFEYPEYPGKFKKFYVRDGVNYIHDVHEKEIAVNQLKEDIDYALANGFNPFMPKIYIEDQLNTAEKEIDVETKLKSKKPWSTEIAMNKFLDYCTKSGLEPNTIRTYVSFINNLRKWVQNLPDPLIPFSELTDVDIQSFLDYNFFEEEWTPRTYNNHSKFMSQLFSRVAKLEKKYNPNIKYTIDLSDLILKKDKAEKNKYYTPQVAAKVKKEISKNPEMYRYSKWIFYSCMRPKEIRLLKIQDIDMVSRQIKVNGKTGYRFVPICDELMNLISEMNLIAQPLDYYVFGKGKKPNNDPVYHDYFARRYQTIKDNLKLDYNYTLYSWKHTRVVSLITAGFDDNQVMTLTGHRDRSGFEAYKRDLIIDNTVMKGKTIDF
ncbi:hypothetical protein SMI01S_11540 [Sphingobacterium mizutaii NBRC 14946 = DSM 11724]|uniref:Site-specific recombinase XerD n=2 Tax=Sphingobacterium mizutaii TaxID=1010 RepID=A0AAJ4XD14_9SPHI|nr:phage integrase N-terminal SAM-like domain-containing protein [Sphingobacterium mizutaii]GEM67548.1 hypothetical protein SMI01S_11540 [Sphingobacterium mizutaii NBRC 14946 = DSM 11724]SDL14011.1 Site-specific recombinase XerD [Sphingobacterium mizutaii]SNV52054.1 Site-specific recombinase XerD [Sphingobacterium mizutaii]